MSEQTPSGNAEKTSEGYHPKFVSWIKYWLFTTDHKDVGILYFVTSVWFLLIGGLLAMIFRTQLAYPGQSFLTGSTYNQAISNHGLIMVLFFLTPLGLAFSNYFLPLQIGAKDVAFPRFNAFSYWLYLGGGLLLISGFFVPGGAGAAGWTNYAPLSSLKFFPGGGESLMALGLLLDWASLTMGSVNLITTVLTMRAPGMTWWKIPMFTWFALLTQILLIFSVPSILLGTLVLVVDRTIGTLYFVNPGGSSILWDHMWWFFAHPEVYVVVFPSFGVIAEVLSTFSGRPFYAKRALLLAVGLGLIPFSYSIYGHHMALTGINLVEREIFTINTEINTIPSGLVVILSLLTLVGGSIKFKAPLLFALGSLAVFIVGGITGVFDSSVFLDQQLRGTFQVVSHFHYIMPGAGIFGMWAAIYYWLPRWTGRMYNERVGKIHFLLSFIFFNGIFFPMNLLLDMPRRVFTYLPQVDPLLAATNGVYGWNTIETIFAWAFGITQILLIYNVVWGWKKGPTVGLNPWRAATPEFTGDAGTYVSNYPAVYAPSLPVGGEVGGILADGGSMLQTSLPLHGHAVEAGVMLSSRPVMISLGMFLAFLGAGTLNIAIGLPLLFLGIAVGVWGVLGWVHDDLHDKYKLPEEEDPGDTWPLTPPSDMSFSWWKIKVGVWLFLAGDIVFFGALIASYLFIRMNLPVWPDVGSIHNITLGTFNTAVFFTSALFAYMAFQSIREGDRIGLISYLSITFALGLAFLVVEGFDWLSLLNLKPPFNVASGLPGSTYFLMTGVHAVHVIVGLLVALYLIVKAARGAYARESYVSVQLFTVYWALIVLVSALLFPLLYLL